jgi:hypothetical protein
MSDPSIGEQRAFSEAHDLSKRLRDDAGISGAEVGRGLLVAAIDALRKSIGNQDTAKLLYTFADAYAVRDTSNKGN